MPQCKGLGAVDLEAYGGGQCDEGVVGVEANGVDGLLCHLARAVHLLFNYNRTSSIEQHTGKYISYLDKY